jgi:alkaline phosphatase
LVFTCEFPHATPADCAAHSYSRGKYEWKAPQMVHNGLDVVIGGGVSILTNNDKEYLHNKGYGIFLNDIDNFRNYNGDKMWALFCDKDMAFDIDRDPVKEPSLAEMTQTAIGKLSRNENGFFLMVEGSKIDWAAHANDAAAIITDMIAFDKACGVALDFAKSNKETVVIIAPDHGNSGFSIGSNKCANYSSMTKDELFGGISKFKTSVAGLIEKLKETDPANLQKVVFELTGINLTEEEHSLLLQCADYNLSTLSNDERMKGSRLTKVVAGILDKYTCFGFTTNGHTGEEVFLAVYDPTPNRLTGHHTNIELNHYLRRSAGLEQSLESLTEKYFAKHTDVFEGYTYTINAVAEGKPVLEVKDKKNKKKTILEITPNTNIVKLKGQEVELSSVIIYVDKNNTFYVPQSLKDLLQ